jgi:hypothetical protein
MAHVGGIVAGLALTPFFKRRKHKLFDRGPHGATKTSPAPQALPPEETPFEN